MHDWRSALGALALAAAGAAIAVMVIYLVVTGRAAAWWGGV